MAAKWNEKYKQKEDLSKQTSIWWGKAKKKLKDGEIIVM